MATPSEMIIACLERYESERLRTVLSDSTPDGIVNALVEQAIKDAALHAVRDAVRDEGWKAYARGGLTAMQMLLDDVLRLRPDTRHSTIDRCWDGIGYGEAVWVA